MGHCFLKLVDDQDTRSVGNFYGLNAKISSNFE